MRSGVVAQQRGLNGRTDHIAERHDGTWHGDWDRRRPHYENDRWYAFNGADWIGLDAGFYPWDYYPYYAYDYYPYDYTVDGSIPLPPEYQADGTAALVPDAIVQNVQTQLTQMGYYGGSIDGLFGPTTRDALARYQADKNLSVTGSLSPDTLQSFGLPTQLASN